MTEQPAQNLEYEEYIQGPDRATRIIRYAIVFVVVSILSVLLYAVVVGVFMPSAPRTLVESSLLAAQAALRKAPTKGEPYAALARAQYAGGDTKAAWQTITEGKKRVKDRTVLFVRGTELDFLLLEGKNAEVLKLADGYIRDEADAIQQEKLDRLKQGVNVPDQVDSRPESVGLIIKKATAQGNMGKWKDAVKTFDTVLALTDTAADVMTLRGWAKLKAGDAKGAVQDFKRSLTFIPDDASAKAGLKQAETAAKAKKK